jgi:predicted NUDIX family phosphoesterase
MDELVLCFDAEVLDALGRFQGISYDVESYFPAIVSPSNCRYLPRSKAETDLNRKQIIPYVLMIHENFVFTYRRGKYGGENRLHEKLSVGVGGHIQPFDVTLFSRDGVGYREGMLREVYEEVDLNTGYREACVALINDDSTEVGKVHFGIVHIFQLESRDVKKKQSAITEARFVSFDQASNTIDRYEEWSKLCLANIYQLAQRSGVAEQ